MADTLIDPAMMKEMIAQFSARDIARIFTALRPDSEGIGTTYGAKTTEDLNNAMSGSQTSPTSLEEVNPQIAALAGVMLQSPELRERVMKEALPLLLESYDPKTLAAALKMTLAERSADERESVSDDTVLMSAAELASRYGQTALVAELLDKGLKDSIDLDEKTLVFNAMLRNDLEMLRLLADRFGEDTIRSFGDIGYNRDYTNKDYMEFTAQQIGAALDALSPTLSEVNQPNVNNPQVLAIEAQLMLQGENVTMSGVLEDREITALRKIVGGSMTTGDLQGTPVSVLLRMVEPSAETTGPEKPARQP